MDLADNSSDPRIDEKAQRVEEDGITQHNEVLEQRNGGDVEDLTDMGPVSCELEFKWDSLTLGR